MSLRSSASLFAEALGDAVGGVAGGLAGAAAATSRARIVTARSPDRPPDDTCTVAEPAVRAVSMPSWVTDAMLWFDEVHSSAAPLTTLPAVLRTLAVRRTDSPTESARTSPISIDATTVGS